MDTPNGEPQALLFAQHFVTLPDPRKRLPQHPLLSICVHRLGGPALWS
jgi:hypothetical protein